MSESGSGEDMTRRRGSSPPTGPASLPGDDDLLWEILLRLPPQPSSLRRASAVCRQWRRLATDPKFLRRFREHHRKPPLLGFFEYRDGAMVFTSVLDPPDRIRPERFDLGRYSDRRDYGVLGFRHGRILVLDHVDECLVVCAPITGEQRRVAVPPEFMTAPLNGEVLCAAGDIGHVHGECHSDPFKVVLVSVIGEDRRPIACVYSSETGLWGSLISSPCSPAFDYGRTGRLVGNALYWLLWSGMRDSIVEFDLEKLSLVLIDGPLINDDFRLAGCQIIQAEDDITDLDHAGKMGVILSYAEDTDVVFIFVDANVYMVQLNPMQSKKLHETKCILDNYPFTSFYTPGTAIAGGSNGAENAAQHIG